MQVRGKGGDRWLPGGGRGPADSAALLRAAGLTEARALPVSPDLESLDQRAAALLALLRRPG
ncbi:MAG TPA: hypothetical protein VH307_29480 [Streptosporangiaceae bacterium]|nr:hypothetical protein [Streptosporangiaceae bacterium]